MSPLARFDGRPERFELAVFQFDADALFHESNANEQSSFLFAADDGAFIPGEGTTFDANGLTGFETALERQRYAQSDQVADLTEIGDELGHVHDRRELLDGAGADS